VDATLRVDRPGKGTGAAEAAPQGAPIKGVAMIVDAKKPLGGGFAPLLRAVKPACRVCGITRIMRLVGGGVNCCRRDCMARD